MNKFLKNKFFFGLLAILCFVIAWSFHSHDETGNTTLTKRFEQRLHKKEQRLANELKMLSQRAKTQSYDELFLKKPTYYNSLLENSGFALLIYENDTLKFWSDNSIAVENWIKEVCLDTRMVKLKNGWFEVMRPPTDPSTARVIIGLLLVRNEFPYQNKYLVNDYWNSFETPAETRLVINPSVGENKINNKNGEYLFSLEFNTHNSYLGTKAQIAFIFNLLGFLFTFLFLWQMSLFSGRYIGKSRALLLMIIVTIGLRYITIQWSIPEVFYDFELFNPSIYADANSIWLTSLGDLLINAVLCFMLSYFILRKWKIRNTFKNFNRIGKIIASFISLLVFFWFSWELTSLFISLVQNSGISFSINNLFSVNLYTYIALIITGLLLLTYFLIADKLATIFKFFNLSKIDYSIVFTIAVLIHSLVLHFKGILDLILVFWPYILLAYLSIVKRKQNGYPFSHIVFIVFLFSFFIAHIFIKYTDIKEVESRKIYAQKLADERDPVAEFLFDEIIHKVEHDTILTACVNTPDKQPATFEKRLKQQYFSGFWGKYDIKITFFDSLCVPLVSSPNASFNNNLYFDELIQKKGIPTSSEYLTFIDNESGKISYLARIPINKRSKLGTLYIEMDAKFISDEIGFPELLLDRNIGLSQELNNYSYAKYKYNKLVNQYGGYPYSLSMIDFGNETSKNNFTITDKDNYNHLLYKPNPYTLIVLSKKVNSTVDRITVFSYLFTFFSLLLLTLLLIRQTSEGTLLGNFSFKYRIQSLLVVIVLTSLALFGSGTMYYIKQQFEVENKENISEKIHSVLMAIEPDFADQKLMTKGISDYVTFMIKKWSNVFFTDITLYDKEGNLYASSRPEVFNEGLTSKKMNPEAFLQMAVLNKSEFIHQERIGKLEYLSAYIPFKNQNGELLAYLNLPYFAKQNDLERKISDFLVALINIYVLLFALSIVAALFIANYVTEPLKLIQDKLGQIKLGKTNELIEWPQKDEIGSLVSEYNRMILELSKSAELLAKSERESAWREMAKQVAHEIKNPLTPMKLSVQHLMRVWKDNAPDMEQKMERLTHTIIEQIDTLSTIATEFSNFAKMPKANLEEINLNNVLRNSIDLFKGTENITLHFDNTVTEHPIVMADKEQLLRVFNNLIKNAIQAIPEDKNGEIEICLKQQEQNYLISIKDNGSGISSDVRDKIFVPNFTTKTAGMGLGLAMVKSIIESHNGKIWFETEENRGTTFYIQLISH